MCGLVHCKTHASLLWGSPDRGTRQLRTAHPVSTLCSLSVFILCSRTQPPPTTLNGPSRKQDATVPGLQTPEFFNSKQLESLDSKQDCYSSSLSINQHQSSSLITTTIRHHSPSFIITPHQPSSLVITKRIRNSSTLPGRISKIRH
jgi:hypothetical protein